VQDIETARTCDDAHKEFAENSRNSIASADGGYDLSRRKEYRYKES
jgi:hypothetical protein